MPESNRTAPAADRLRSLLSGPRVPRVHNGVAGYDVFVPGDELLAAMGDAPAATRPRPRLLDLFCGEGGCSAGYVAAGFDVIGVDLKPQPLYPFEFVNEGALGYLERLLWNRLHGEPIPFDAIHASPPCQSFTALSVMWNAKKEHVDLLGPTRALLEQTGLPWVIENVPGAPMGETAVTICGSALGLGTETHELRRHRRFEASFALVVPPCAHTGKPVLGIYGDHARDRRRSRSVEDGQFRAAEGLAMARDAMEMPWASWRGLSQAIPPAYTELIGHRLLSQIRQEVAA